LLSEVKFHNTEGGQIHGTIWSTNTRTRKQYITFNPKISISTKAILLKKLRSVSQK